MYAIIEDRGRQYTVKQGEVLLVDLCSSKPEETLVFDRVLMVGGAAGTRVGTPTLPGVKVTAKVLGEAKGKKLVFGKFKRRKNYRRKMGHRQHYTQVRIESITGAGE